MTAREIAERIVAENINQWGWGPLSGIDGLAEHMLAVTACEAGVIEAEKMLMILREMIYLYVDPCDIRPEHEHIVSGAVTLFRDAAIKPN